MKRKLILSNAALRDLDDVFEYLAERFADNARAREFVDAIVAQIEKIAGLPSIVGRPRDNLLPGLRSFPFRGYLIFMRYEEDSLVVVNILHSRRDTDAAFLPRRRPPPMTGAGTDHTKPKLEGGPAIILVRPQLAVNIGMCARAMANFGLSDLRLVAPREGWPRTGAYRKGAYAAAAGAVHLLESARVFPDVASAIVDLSFVHAATARGRGQMKPVHIPAQAMPIAAQAIAAGERRGVMFGPERTGLDNDDVALADAILTFPVNPAYASLNLAQAVLLTGYEWFRAAHGDVLPFDTSERSPPATREMTAAFFDFLEEQLDARQFFRPITKKPVMARNLRNMFHRMSLTEQDVRTLWGVVVRLVEGPRREPNARRRKKLEEAEAREAAAKAEARRVPKGEPPEAPE